jgi:hypothetical protein
VTDGQDYQLRFVLRIPEKDSDIMKLSVDRTTSEIADHSSNSEICRLNWTAKFRRPSFQFNKVRGDSDLEGRRQGVELVLSFARPLYLIVHKALPADALRVGDQSPRPKVVEGL